MVFSRLIILLSF